MTTNSFGIRSRIQSALSRRMGLYCYPFFRLWSRTANIYIHKNSRVSLRAVLDTRLGGQIRIGQRTEILPGVQIATYGGDISIGADCSINPLVVIYGHGGVKIGDFVQIATQVTIIPANHIFRDPTTPIAKQGLTTRGITIEDDVWVGSGARILDGVTVGRGSIIGANSVVTKSTDPTGIYVGCPARFLRWRN